jgi:hypothetical protein
MFLGWLCSSTCSLVWVEICNVSSHHSVQLHGFEKGLLAYILSGTMSFIKNLIFEYVKQLAADLTAASLIFACVKSEEN